MTENNQDLIARYYATAAEELNETILADKDLWYSYIVNLPEHLHIVYTIVVFHEQVFNGGLHQYFFNAYGQFGYDTLENLRKINANESAVILEKALNEVNNLKDGVGEFRSKVFNRKIGRIVDFDDDLGDYLNNLDQQYYSLDENLEKLMVNYINEAK